MSTHTRIFPIGFDLSVNRSLLKRFARITHGKSIFIPPDSPVELYIADQLQRILHSIYTQINIRWTCRTGTNLTQYVSPIHPPDTIFAETEFLVYALFNHDEFIDNEIEYLNQRENHLSAVRIN